jgi:hypothetical protein
MIFLPAGAGNLHEPARFGAPARPTGQPANDLGQKCRKIAVSINNQLLKLCVPALLRRNIIAFKAGGHPYFAGNSDRRRKAGFEKRERAPLCLPTSSA